MSNYVQVWISLFLIVVSLKHQNSRNKTITAMNKKTVFFFVGGGILLWIAYFFYRRILAVQRLQINVDLPSEFRKENGFIVFTQRLMVNNASTVDLDISTVNLDVYSAGYFVGKASLPQSQTIAANGTSVIVAKVTCSITDILQAVGYTISDLISKNKLKLSFQGTVGAYGFTAPVNQTTSLEIPQWILKLF